MRKIPLLLGAASAVCAIGFGGVSAYFSDRTQIGTDLLVGTGGIMLEEASFDEEGAGKIVVNHQVRKDPLVKNTGSQNVYVFMETEVPVISSAGTNKPVFQWNLSREWELAESKEDGDRIKNTYVYGSKTAPVRLARGEATPSLFEGVMLAQNPGISALAGQELSLDIRAYGVPGDSFTDSEQSPDVERLLAPVRESSRGILVTDVIKNKFSPAKTGAELKEDLWEEGNESARKISVKNSGNTGIFTFLRIKNPLVSSGGSLIPSFLMEKNGSVISEGTGEWTLIEDEKKGELVFGRNAPLAPGEETESLFDKIYINPALSVGDHSSDMSFGVEAISIQADGLPLGGNSSDGYNGVDNLKNVYDLCNDESGLLYSKILKEDLFYSGNVGIEIVEDFPTPPPLHIGENAFKKEVSVKNTGNLPVFTRVFSDFSSDEVRAKSQVSTDQGESYVPFEELSQRLGPDWEYKDQGALEGYFYYKKPLEPGETTSTLFTNIKTLFNNAEEISDFDVNVYAEVIEAKSGSGYETEWTEALKDR